MANLISLRGFVSSEIETHTLDSGVSVGSFRMGSCERRRDPITKLWEDGPPNWFKVKIYRALATNTVMSIHKGDRIIVIGKLKISTYLRRDGTSGTAVDIEAESIGPDLKFGVVAFHKVAGGRAVENNNTPDGGAGEGTGYSDNAGAENEPPQAQSWSSDVSSAPSADGDEEDSEDDSDDDDQAAALTERPEALQAGEKVDHATGEIVTTGVPF